MNDIISSDMSADLKNSWGTDPVVFKAMNREFNFYLDAAANKDNAKCTRYLTKEHNALDVDWRSLFIDDYRRSVWVNPPYGRGFIKKFMAKAIEMKKVGLTTVMLVPATLDAQWLPINEISEIRIVTGGRLSFYCPMTNKKIGGNTKGSMFVIFRPSSMPCFTRLIDRNELLAYGAF